jgi:hypothetical protein
MQSCSKNTKEKGKKLLKENPKIAKIKKANNNHKNVTYSESKTFINGYGGEFRQIFVEISKSDEPAIILTNDFELSVEEVIRKYSKRWLEENAIEEQLDFFHMNRNASTASLKISLELVMTTLAHNLYALLAREVAKCELNQLELFNRYVDIDGSMEIFKNEVLVKLAKKRDLPAILNFGEINKDNHAFHNKRLTIQASSHT